MHIGATDVGLIATDMSKSFIVTAKDIHLQIWAEWISYFMRHASDEEYSLSQLFT